MELSMFFLGVGVRILTLFFRKAAKFVWSSSFVAVLRARGPPTD
jgi:hypothetical protein